MSNASPEGVTAIVVAAAQVVKGLDVVDAMQRVQTARGDRPVTDVVINSVAISVAD